MTRESKERGEHERAEQEIHEEPQSQRMGVHPLADRDRHELQKRRSAGGQLHQRVGLLRPPLRRIVGQAHPQQTHEACADGLRVGCEGAGGHGVGKGYHTAGIVRRYRVRERKMGVSDTILGQSDFVRPLRHCR